VTANATQNRFPWFTLVAHLVAFAVVFQLTAFVFEGGTTYVHAPWVAAWILATLCWVALGLSVAIPASFWPVVVEKAPRVVGISIVATGLAMFAGYAAEALWK